EPLWFEKSRKYVSHTSAPALLYDLSSDLPEKVNLLEHDPEVASRLHEQLTHLRAKLTWDGSLSGDWANPGNWIPAAVPARSDIVYSNLTGLGTVSQVLSANYGINSITVDPSAGVDLSIGVLTGGELTIANGIDMAAANIDLTIAAPVSLSQSQVWTVNEAH